MDSKKIIVRITPIWENSKFEVSSKCKIIKGETEVVKKEEKEKIIKLLLKKEIIFYDDKCRGDFGFTL